MKNPVPKAEDLLSAPAYIKAYKDVDFLTRDELRPVRLQLELLKPELLQQEQHVVSTIVVFGSARSLDAEAARAQWDKAQDNLARNPDDPAARRAAARAEKKLEHSVYYEAARAFSRIASTAGQLPEGKGFREFVVVTGGGPGIMEAGNRGAWETGHKSIGLNITLPHEQAPNPYITPELCFNFHYFAIRKMHFLLRARAMVAFPGGFGTLDELFETLTLIQTHKMPAIPIVLYARKFWDRIVNFEALVEEGVISPEDIALFHYAESPEEIWDLILSYYERENAYPGI